MGAQCGAQEQNGQPSQQTLAIILHVPFIQAAIDVPDPAPRISCTASIIAQDIVGFYIQGSLYQEVLRHRIEHPTKVCARPLPALILGAALRRTCVTAEGRFFLLRMKKNSEIRRVEDLSLLLVSVEGYRTSSAGTRCINERRILKHRFTCNTVVHSSAHLHPLED